MPARSGERHSPHPPIEEERWVGAANGRSDEPDRIGQADLLELLMTAPRPTALGRPTPRATPVRSAVLPERLIMTNLDRVDPIWVESKVILDAGDGHIGRLVGPHRIDRARAAQRDAEVGGVPLVGAVSGMVGPFEERHVDVAARDVVDRRIARFPQRQRVQSIGNDAAGGLYDDSLSAAGNGDRMVRAGNLDGLRCRFSKF
jgi:hypothetical protein